MGFKQLSTATLAAICARHGVTYTSRITRGRLQLLVSEVPDVHQAREEDTIPPLDANSESRFIKSLSEYLHVNVRVDDSRGNTRTFHADVNIITQHMCDMIRSHPSGAIVDVLLTETGIKVLYSCVNDSRNNLRNLRKNKPQLFVVPHTDPMWYKKKATKTTAKKSPKPKSWWAQFIGE